MADVNIQDNDITISRLPWLVQRAIAQPDNYAISFQNQQISFDELLQRSKLVAEKLLVLGLGEGDILALALVNTPFYVELLHACTLIGAILLPLNIRLSRDELHHPLEETAAKVCICETGELYDLLDGIAQSSTTDLRLVSTAEFKRVDRGEKHICVDRIQVDSATPLCIMYTSGTTGRPKGVLLSYRNFEASAQGTRQNFSLSEEDCWLACMPLYHIGGLSVLTRSAIVGFHVVLQERFDPQQALQAMEQQVSMVSFVPNMLQRVMAIAGGNGIFPHLKSVILGGEFLSEKLRQQASDRQIPVVESYGLTEACSQIAASSMNHSLKALSVFQGVDLKIIDDEGRIQSFGQEGEILIRGACISPAYFDDSSINGQLTQEGWLHSGDIGRFESDGSLSVLDRRVDLIISGGENIYPREVERVLLQHPALSDALVFGENDERYGRRVVAAVVSKNETVPDADDLKQYCRTQLAAFKVPARIEFVSHLERSAVGKLIRK